MLCPMMSKPVNNGEQNWIEHAECEQDDNCAWWDGKQCAIKTIAQNNAPVELEQSVTIESTCDAESIAKAVVEALNHG